MKYYHVSNTLRDPGNTEISKTRTVSSVAGVEMEEKTLQAVKETEPL